MRNKVWFWICLSISIFLVLITIVVVFTQNEKINEYKEQLARYEIEISRQDSIYYCDSIKYQYSKNPYYRGVTEMFISDYRMKQNDIQSESEYDSITLQRVLEAEYEKMLVRYENHYGVNQEIIRTLYHPSFPEEISIGLVYDDPLDYQEPKRTVVQQPIKPQFYGFDIVSGSASILGLFFTFFFRYRDNKEKREKKEQQSQLRSADTGLIEDLTSSDYVGGKKKADLSIDEKTYDNGYETTLTIRNNGEAEAKNVMVEILPDKKQNLTNARIVNAEILPMEIVYPKGSFQVTVECWYPKAYRDVVVTWEDTKPRKIVQNVQLSKNYVV